VTVVVVAILADVVGLASSITFGAQVTATMKEFYSKRRRCSSGLPGYRRTDLAPCILSEPLSEMKGRKKKL
jgi:hypothetical protein